MNRRQNSWITPLLAAVSVITALGGTTVQTLAQDNTPAANVSPSLVSLFLLLVGLVGIGIVSTRMVPPRNVNPIAPVDDDSLVPDDEQV